MLESPHYSPAAVFLTPEDRASAGWTKRSVDRNMSAQAPIVSPFTSMTLELETSDGLTAKVDLGYRRSWNATVEFARASFGSSEALRAKSACLRAVADLLDAKARLSRTRSTKFGIQSAITISDGDEASLELIGPDAWLALATVFGKSYAENWSGDLPLERNP